MITESFKGRIQKGSRVQIPRLVRWRHKLKPATVMEIQVEREDPYNIERFYAQLRRDGRITVPKLTAQILSLKPGDVVEVKISIPTDNLERVMTETKARLEVSTGKRALS